MDERLVRWARAVKSRRRQAGLHGPVLWLFTDPARAPDPVGAVRRLPAGLCGVVFRHDGVPGRPALLQAVWRACRVRRVAMVVAGEPARFAGPGVHLRGGRGRCGGAGLRTASAHGAADLVRAARAGAAPVFLSPAFPTLSHAGSSELGAVRWARMAGRGRGARRGAVMALGGVDGRSVRRLPRWCAGAGAIGALLGGPR